LVGTAHKNGMIILGKSLRKRDPGMETMGDEI